MFNIEWTINGRKVPANRIADEFGKAIRAEAIDKAKQAVARIKCPVHGTGARSIRTTGSGDRVQFEYEACCEGLKQAIAAKLR